MMPEFTTFGYIQLGFLLFMLVWGLIELKKTPKKRA